MYLAGIFGSLEILVVLGAVLLIVIPTILRKMRSRQDYTEKLDQLERLERMYRDGSLSERDFKRQKKQILRNK